MATPTGASSTRARRSTLSSVQRVQSDVPVQTPSAGPALRMTPAYPIGRGSPIFRHLHIGPMRVPQSTTGHAGTNSGRRSEILPSAQSHGPNERDGQGASRPDDVASSISSMGDTTEEEGELTQHRIAEPQPAQHPGEVHFPVRPDSLEYRVRWTDTEAAELQAVLNGLNGRRNLLENPPAPAPSYSGSSGSPAAPSPQVPSPPGGEAGAGGVFPTAHIVLLPNASVAEFRMGGCVNDDGRPDERRVPGDDQTLFIHYSSAEALKAIANISAIILLPRSRLLRLLAVTSLRSPVFAFVVFTALIALVVWGFMSYEPAHRLLLGLLRHVTSLIKFIGYYTFQFCCLAVATIVKATWSAYAAGSLAVRYLLVAWLELTVVYLSQLRDAETEAAGRVILEQ